MPYLDFEKIVQNPKLMAGFSDPTGILFPVTAKYDIATIYGMNFSSYGMDDYHESVKNHLEILKGNIIEQHSFDMFENERVEKITGLEGYNLTDKVYWKILGDINSVKIKGRVFAGCFDLIDILAGTKYDGATDFSNRYKDDGIIWCFDNCDLSKEEIIRSLWKFNEFGYFKYTKGVIFGRSGNDDTLVGYDMKKALEDSVIAKMNFPVVYDADISHKGPCMTIVNGSIAEFDIYDGKAKVKFELK